MQKLLFTVQLELFYFFPVDCWYP